MAYATQVVEDFTDKYGIPAWVSEDEAVFIEADKRIHKFKESVDLATAGSKNKPYQPAAGEYFVPRIVSRRKDNSIQTFSEWIKKAAAVE